MADYRIHEHPILPVEERPKVEFTWQGQTMQAYEGETISAALFAGGVRTFGHHHKDGAPQGLFCANGQCAQCLVMADGLPVKACMTPVHPGMQVEPMDGNPALPDVQTTPEMQTAGPVEVECLIIGGGPAGLAAAIELGKAGVRVLIADDKHRLGGKLVLQTHKFFGSIDACYAGTRGTDIATILEQEVHQFENVQVWLNTTALAVFSDRKVGLLREGRYVIVQPHVLLVATGARENSLTFKGNTLPGVYGAGAFQTLVNRDLVRSSERIFIVGGGNVGLIAGYHALQAGIQVVGLCEALPECGGYKVHKDKLARLGVPIYVSHTILSANGKDEVESTTIAQIDENWRPIPGTEKAFACDTVLVAVGLSPVDEFIHKAREFGLPVYAAGDAEEIAEASAAMFTGRIRGLEIARSLGRDVGQVPQEWHRIAEILKSRPGATVTEDIPEVEEGVFPVLHCAQEIPCNPCTSICPQNCIVMEGEDIRSLPEYVGEGCIGCEKCVAICPGLAITLVDYRNDPEHPTVTIPYEFPAEMIHAGDSVTVLDTEGAPLGEVKVMRVRAPKFSDRALLVRVRAPREIARHIAGIRVQEPGVTEPLNEYVARIADDEIVCRCERVTAGEIRALIREGARDMNHIKGVTRAGMGACGGKTCTNLVKRLFREEGVSLQQVTENTRRPLFIEASLGAFAGVVAEGGATEEVRVVHATDAHEGGM
ncbi:MAG: sulfurtransferase [Chloroflexi bacterium]|nr:MAG: sulfurtransferase [Chloroflexota bacterium]RLC76500.1 MAG: sulfurtransferase [Chloroflexota bacterium]HEY72045.1 FAD-dependent oxidoreductase [Thermoflexia bacterium]